MPISVCVISGAEAHRIAGSLASVADWTAETIVVLNEEVADGTDRVVASFGGQVHRRKWEGFVAQKNAAFAFATQPWILGLDTDEVVSPELRDEIISLFRGNSLFACAAYSFPRCSFYMGRWIRHGDWYPDRGVRLVQRGKARWEGINPHDHLVVDGPIGRLRNDLLHYSNPNISSYVSKINYFADLHLQHQLAVGARWSAPEAVFRAGWRFVRAYFLRRGFLDGYPGFFIAASTAYSTLVRHSRLFEHGQPAKPLCAPAKSP